MNCGKPEHIYNRQNSIYVTSKANRMSLLEPETLSHIFTVAEQWGKNRTSNLWKIPALLLKFHTGAGSNPLNFSDSICLRLYEMLWTMTIYLGTQNFPNNLFCINLERRKRSNILFYWRWTHTYKGVEDFRGDLEMCFQDRVTRRIAHYKEIALFFYWKSTKEFMAHLWKKG